MPSFSLPSISIGQGIYYFITGIWPLISIRTFEAITSPKRDDWLVKTVGVLVAVIGVVLIMAGLRRRVTDEIVTLAVGSALGLTAVDLVYVGRGRIPRTYLLDALAEVVLVGGWVLARMMKDDARPHPG